MLDKFARMLSDPVNLLILGCMTGSGFLLCLDRLLALRRARKGA